jgi:integrase
MSVARPLNGLLEQWSSPPEIALGQRLGDIARLRWSNIDLNRDELRLVTAKTSKSMIIPLASPLRRHIEKMPSSGDRAFGTKMLPNPKCFFAFWGGDPLRAKSDDVQACCAHLLETRVRVSPGRSVSRNLLGFRKSKFLPAGPF